MHADHNLLKVRAALELAETQLPRVLSLDPHSFVRRDLHEVMRTEDSLRGIGIRVHRCGECSAWFTPDFEWDGETGVV